VKKILIKKNGDWEFAAFDGEAKQVQKINEASCKSCHTFYKERDFIVRNYLPNSAWEKMK